MDWPIRTLGWKGALVKTGYSSYDKAAAGFTERRPKSKETYVAELQHPGPVTARKSVSMQEETFPLFKSPVQSPLHS